MHAQTRACTHASLPLAEFATLIMAPLPSVQPSCRVRLSLMGAPLLPGCHNPLKLGRFKRCAALKESLNWLPVDRKPVLGSSGPCRCCGGSILHNIREQGVVFYELATTTAILGRKAAHCACAPHHNEQQGWLRVAGLNVATTSNGHAVDARYMNAKKYSAKVCVPSALVAHRRRCPVHQVLRGYPRQAEKQRHSPHSPAIFAAK